MLHGCSLNSIFYAAIIGRCACFALPRSLHTYSCTLLGFAVHISELFTIQWEYTGDSSRTGAENISANRPIFSKSSASEYNPAKLLLNGVGWSIPQSQGIRGAKNLIAQKRFSLHQDPVERHAASSNIGKREQWFWFPSPAANWDGPDFLGRVGGLKDELPWKIRASVIYSARAHHGALRSLAVCQDESTVFTAGVGPGFKGTIQRWEFTGIDCISGYYGHEEVCSLYLIGTFCARLCN